MAGILIPLSSIIVSVASFWYFGERLQISHGIGMLVVIGGATLIALFPPNDLSGQDGITIGEVVRVLCYSFLTTCFLSLEILVTKSLVRRGADGRFIGLHILFACGIYGTVCLVIATAMGKGF